jgi:hypothetical protein
MKKYLMYLAALLFVTTTATAGGFANTTSLALGANGVWSDGATERVSDVEACVNGAMSLSPHISGVGSVNYGFLNNAYRSTAGVRITATDVNNRDFSVGIGVQYHLYNGSELKPNEWCPDVAVGFRPWPKTVPAFTLTGLAWYGLDSNNPGADIGIRWRFNL